VTLTGKCPPNRDPVWQWTELVQDTKALMVQDTKMATSEGNRTDQITKYGFAFYVFGSAVNVVPVC